jgi:hypothetical protein
VSAVPYLRRQSDRVREIARWLDGEISAGRVGGGDRLDYLGVSLITSVEWLLFRGVVDISHAPALLAFCVREGGRPSLAQSRPPT